MNKVSVLILMKILCVTKVTLFKIVGGISSFIIPLLQYPSSTAAPFKSFADPTADSIVGFLHKHIHLSDSLFIFISEILVEHNSVMRGAIPCLPVPLAWFCLVWNILLPGSGTIWSGLFNLCVGQPRFAVTTSAKGRFGAFIINIIVGISQLFTVLFCLVGWGWSIWWGVTMLRLARKWKRFKASEAINGDPEAREGAGGILPAPGVPIQALRGVERAR